MEALTARNSCNCRNDLRPCYPEQIAAVPAALRLLAGNQVALFTNSQVSDFRQSRCNNINRKTGEMLDTSSGIGDKYSCRFSRSQRREGQRDTQNRQTTENPPDRVFHMHSLTVAAVYEGVKNCQDRVFPSWNRRGGCASKKKARSLLMKAQTGWSLW